jgi:hypothetical protein
MNKIKKYFSNLVAGQYFWFISAAGAIALFSYYQSTGHRIFGEVEAEKWSPQGSSNHSQIHHK